MFSTPSLTLTVRQQALQSNAVNVSNMNLLNPAEMDFNEFDYEDEDDSDLYRYPDDADSEEEYILQKNMNTMRVEEIPVKEPMLNAVPKKSALKKKSCGGGSGPSTPSNQDNFNRPSVVRHDNNSCLVG